MLNKIKAFIIKNILIEKHYRFSLIMQIFSLLITLLIFFFIDRFFSTEIKKHIDINMNYFSYIFVSFIIFNYSGANSTISQRINFDITSGVFEFIMNQKNSILPYIISLWAYSFIISTIELIIYLNIAYYLGVIKPNINLFSFFAIITLSSLIFSSISFLSSSFVVIFKRGDIISFLLSIFESIFAGVYFPTSIIGKLSNISELLPLTHSIRAAQKIFYENANLFELREFYILLAFFLILTPLSVFSFKKAVYFTRKLGNLKNY